MQEIELKCQIPQGGRDTVHMALQALAGQSGQALAVLPLRAAYFDTPARALAGRRMALRVRQEGDSWVQTLKAAGSTTLVRVEDNQPLPAPADPAQVRAELARHPEGPAREALRTALGWDAAQDPLGLHCGLVALYQTDIRRTHVRLDWPWDAATPGASAGQVELALDEGWIGAGAHRLPVCELEIESVAGDPQAVIEAARWFVQRHGLWLDTRTKAHRGGMLADLAFGPAQATTGSGQVKAQAAPLTPAQQVADDLAAWMATLAQLGAWDRAAAGGPDAQAATDGTNNPSTMQAGAKQPEAPQPSVCWLALSQSLRTWQAEAQGMADASEQAVALDPRLTEALDSAQPPEGLSADTQQAWVRSPAPTLASLSLLSALLAAQAA